MLKKVAFTLVPIHRNEIKKCISMGMMFFFILFNYDLLRILKDSLVVPNIGAEAVSFVKMYMMTPIALSFMLLYTYLTEHLSFGKIFIWIALFFLTFFILFAFVLYPNHQALHPDPTTITNLIKSKIYLFSFEFNLIHLKWFLKIYGKWIFVSLYLMAELWGSAMIFLLFWQFANHTTKTDEAKRLYPMYSFIGHLGALLSAFVVRYYTSKAEHFITYCMITAIICTVTSMLLFAYNNHIAIKAHIVIKKADKKSKEIRTKLTILDSMKIIFSSKYLGLIIITVIAYGTCINLIEGVWRSKASQLYTDTHSYSYFMSNYVMKYTSICAIVSLLLSGTILRMFGWLFGALVLPIIMSVTGISFFLFAIFGEHLAPYFSSFGMNVLFIAVFIGTAQNVLTKAFKYSFFDITKEMTYIPAEPNLRSKGKAAVDVIGARWAKSIGSFIQSGLFIIFPFATYDTLAPYLMVIYIVIIFIWFVDIKKLYAAYTQKVHEHEH